MMICPEGSSRRGIDMGKPSDNVTLTLLISPGRDRQLKELAKRARVSVSDLVRDALKFIYGDVDQKSEVGHGS